jgi:hypothetical protein
VEGKRLGYLCECMQTPTTRAKKASNLENAIARKGQRTKMPLKRCQEKRKFSHGTRRMIQLGGALDEGSFCS